MISKLENKIIIYVSVFIGILLNSHRLFALFPGKRLINNFWVFNLPELVYQSVINMLFALLVGMLNLKLFKQPKYNTTKGYVLMALGNVVVALVCVIIAHRSQKVLFNNVVYNLINLGGTFLRFAFTTVTMVVLTRFLLLLENKEKREKENKRLQEAYFNAEIKNLKGQINPHFLFNSLSNLSALIRENPDKAQVFINNLSKVFRYTLRTQTILSITLEEELKVFTSYAQLQEIRLENSLNIVVDIPQQYRYYKLPVMSLQPLLENAIKHNYASAEMPLLVKVYIVNNTVVVENNLQKNNVVEESTGVGLVNLAERYKLLYNKEIVIEQTNTSFKVSLPLQTE